MQKLTPFLNKIKIVLFPDNVKDFKNIPGLNYHKSAGRRKPGNGMTGILYKQECSGSEYHGKLYYFFIKPVEKVINFYCKKGSLFFRFRFSRNPVGRRAKSYGN